MPFVHVAGGRGDAHRSQRADAADAQHDLLHQPHLDVAAVELIGDVLVLLAVGRNVGVEQIERDAPDLHLPDLHPDGTPRKVECDAERLALRVAHRLEGHVVEIVVGIALLLPAVGIERLPEVALLVEQAHRDKRQTQVAGRFEMVAGEHAEAARVDRQTLREPELHTEIGDTYVGLVRMGAQEPGVARLQVGVEAAADAVELRQERFVLRCVLQALLSDAAQHAYGIVAGLFPELGIEAIEQVDGLGIPRPAEIVSNITQPRAETRAEKARHETNERLALGNFLHPDFSSHAPLFPATERFLIGF